MTEILTKVSYVIEVDTGLRYDERSSEVNDYLASENWILIATGSHASTGDSGPASWAVFSLGWIGDGDPEIPPAH